MIDGKITKSWVIDMMARVDSEDRLSAMKYQPGITYTFDIDPNDSFQYLSSPKNSTGDHDRLKEFEKCMNKVVHDIMKYDIEVVVQLECSQPYSGEFKKCARLHAHGLIRFLSLDAIKQFDLYISTELFMMGTIKIDTIKDLEKRYRYMTKNILFGYPEIGHFLGFKYLMIPIDEYDSNEIDRVENKSVTLTPAIDLKQFMPPKNPNRKKRVRRVRKPRYKNQSPSNETPLPSISTDSNDFHNINQNIDNYNNLQF